MIFTVNEKRLVIIIGQSSLRNPYHVHKLKPIIRIKIITTETCDAFFSLYIFTTCGSIEAPVKTPAVIPTIFVTAIANNTIISDSNIIKKPGTMA
jgi:hypothetical protein